MMDEAIAPFLLWDRLDRFLIAAVEHHETIAPAIYSYLDNLYVRLVDNQPVQLQELQTVQFLDENGRWKQPNLAANRIYKLMAELGLDTTGLAGF